MTAGRRAHLPGTPTMQTLREWLADPLTGGGPLKTIETDADVMVTITAPVRKLCPFIGEVDEGTVTISYRPGGVAWELHSVATYLGTFADRPLSHEDFTQEVADILHAAVRSTWTTAGMEVTCDSLLREPVNGPGA